MRHSNQHFGKIFCLFLSAYKRRLQMYREHTLPLLKAMDDEGRLRIVNIRLCSIIDCIFGKLLFFFWRSMVMHRTTESARSYRGALLAKSRSWKDQLQALRQKLRRRRPSMKVRTLFFWQGGIIAHSYCTWSFSKTSNRKWQLLHFFPSFTRLRPRRHFAQ